MKLLRFLRDKCHLKSVKGRMPARERAGTCHVLIDGKATKACVPKLSKLEGKQILTIEGFPEEEKEIFVRAFGEAGAVQCGFCIPGMVISAKGLIDQNPDPTRAEAANAIKNNICRCTGYKKIIDGILLAAKYKREGLPPEKEYEWKLGERGSQSGCKGKSAGIRRISGRCGSGGYDLRKRCPLQVSESPYKSCTHRESQSASRSSRGVYRRRYPGDVKVGHLKQDWDGMIPVGKITHYLGDAIALVAAETPEILEEAKTLVEVEYEELEMVRDPWEAMKENAPKVQQRRQAQSDGALACAQRRRR